MADQFKTRGGRFDLTRRDFMRGTTAAAAAAATLGTLVVPRAVHAQSSNVIKVGLVGCGGRGSGAANNALAAGADNADTEIVALGDMFADKLAESHENLLNGDYGDRVHADDMKKFVGWDAYKGVIEASDVVILATPPHFRPLHLRAAIEAGKHVFCEKPVAVDVPGLRKVMDACKLAKEKNLAVVSGLCYRYDSGKVDLVKKIHDGGIGDIVSLQTNYNSGGLWMNQRQPAWDDMQWQLRNWLYFHWLSGDFVVEQSIHSIDKVMWMMKDEAPIKVTAAGGRVQRTSPEYGNVYDHFNSIIQWKNGVKCAQSSRQWNNADADTSDWAYGTAGTANMNDLLITGKNEWKGKKARVGMYDAEHVALFNSIRDGKPINNGDYMVNSTMVSMMIRMSAYTGKTIYWDKAAAEADRATEPKIAWESTEDLTPPKYEFGPLPVTPVAVPGVTPFK